MSARVRTTVVIPCYNEATRLDAAGFAPLLDEPDVELLFVDDGSRDGTRALLEKLAGPRVTLLTLDVNRGKGEAVRAGMRQAIAAGAAVVGYLDADLSTPAEEMVRLRAILVEQRARAVMGARVALLGRDIRRSSARHYLGRVFATAASAVLGLRVYDTQCGAKLFTVGPVLERALAEPFHSRWAFDVELLGRLGADDGIIEVPLRVWHDVAGSKVRPTDMVRAAMEIGRIGVELRRWRRRVNGQGTS